MAIQLYSVGGFATDTATDIILLRAGIQTSGRVSTLRLNTATSGYAVTTGKKFYACKIIVTNSDVSATASGVSFGYADNDLGLDVTTARTNPVDLLGRPEETTYALAGGIMYIPSNASDRLNTLEAYRKVIIPFAPAGKYMYIKGFFPAPVDVQVWGFEKTV